ncbi:hypothetical protein [Streptomyces sp. NPDC006134]|uniref:hypothetical protein n=1 Tax=Streptomyces sp. NPDC006134 TaxID=3154467 RepID=UPI0033CA64EB
MLFCRDLCRAVPGLDPDGAVTALADAVRGFRMPGATLPGFRERSLRIAAAGIYDLGIHREHVLLPLLRALDAGAAPGCHRPSPVRALPGPGRSGR